MNILHLSFLPIILQILYKSIEVWRIDSLLQSFWDLSLIMCKEALKESLFFWPQETENLAKNSLNNKRFRFIISLSRGAVFPGNSVAQQHYRGHSSFLFLLCRPQCISSSPRAWLLIVAGQLWQFQAAYPHTVIPWVEKTDPSFLILFIRKSFSKAPPKTSPYISQARMALHGP